MIKDNRRINQEMLKQAIKTGDMDLFDYLLEKDPQMSDEKFGKTLNKPLHIACEYGRVAMVEKLVQVY